MYFKLFKKKLLGCEVTPDVNLSHGKYGIRLEVPNHEGMTEYWIRCSNVRAFFHLFLLYNYSLI